MNILIPLFPYRGNIDLKYALRSLRNLANVDEVYIVTDTLPTWIKNVHQIFAKDALYDHNKELNIFNKIVKGAAVLKEFLYMNDDHYILKPLDANNFPLHHKGALISENRMPSDPYRKTIENTLRYFQVTMNYDIHSPMNMTAEGVCKMIHPCINWTKQWGYCVKTLYANKNGLTGTAYADAKLYKSADIPDVLYFSTDNRAMDEKMINRLENKFPGKSKYEK